MPPIAELKVVITVKIDLERWPDPAMRESLFSAMREQTAGGVLSLWKKIIDCANLATTNRIAYDIVRDLMAAGFLEEISGMLSITKLTGWFSRHNEMRLLEFAKFLHDHKLLSTSTMPSSAHEYTVWQYLGCPIPQNLRQNVLNKWIMTGEMPSEPIRTSHSVNGGLIVWKKAIHVLAYVIENRITAISSLSVWCLLLWPTSRATLHDVMRTADREFARAYRYLFDVDLMIRHDVARDEAARILDYIDINEQRTDIRVFRQALAIAQQYELEQHIEIYTCYVRGKTCPHVTDRNKFWALFLLIDHGYFRVCNSATDAGRMFRIVAQLPLEIQLPISALFYPQPSTNHHHGQYIFHPDSVPDVASTVEVIKELLLPA